MASAQQLWKGRIARTTVVMIGSCGARGWLVAGAGGLAAFDALAAAAHLASAYIGNALQLDGFSLLRGATSPSTATVTDVIIPN